MDELRGPEPLTDDAVEMLGRLSPHLIVGIEGAALTAEERSLLSGFAPAGVILFSRNAHSIEQLAELTRSIVEVCISASGRSPVVAADHEGGRISVLAEALGVPPPQMAVARADSAGIPCADVFRETAGRLRSCGINTLLGPLADINSQINNPVIGTRSFGDDPDRVSRLVSEAVGAVRGEGLITCLKHFPGHGSASEDSHLTLPVLGKTMDELMAEDIAPFVRGIESGADAVMTGHIVARGGRLPASMDHEVVSGILRDTLGFGGVVITDALEMAGARLVREASGISSAVPPAADSSYGETGLLVESSLSAGNDLVLFSRPVEAVYRELAEFLRTGSRGFWDAPFHSLSKRSLERISLLQGRAADLAAVPGYRTPGFATGFPGSGSAGVSYGDVDGTGGIYRRAADSSVVLLRDPESVLPMAAGAGPSLSFLGARGDFGSPVTLGFIKSVLRRLGSDVELSMPVEEDLPVIDNGDAVFERIEEEISGEADLYALRAGRARGGAPTVSFLLNRRAVEEKALLRLLDGTDVSVVAGWPYAEMYIGEDRCVIVSFGIYDAAAYRICDILSGGRT